MGLGVEKMGPPYRIVYVAQTAASAPRISNRLTSCGRLAFAGRHTFGDCLANTIRPELLCYEGYVNQEFVASQAFILQAHLHKEQRQMAHYTAHPSAGAGHARKGNYTASLN